MVCRVMTGQLKHHVQRNALSIRPSLPFMSKEILNSTSAQVGYTVPFMSIYAGKYRTEDKSKTEITKTKHNPEKANNTKYSKTKLAWFSRLLLHSATKRGWAYSTILPSPHGVHTAHHRRPPTNSQCTVITMRTTH